MKQHSLLALNLPSKTGPMPTESQCILALPNSPVMVPTDQPHLDPLPFPHVVRAKTLAKHAPTDVDFQPKLAKSLPLNVLRPSQRRANRTEAERLEEFQSDPFVAKVEPVGNSIPSTVRRAD